MNTKLQCPTDLVLMNENKARITAFFVLVLGVAFLLTKLWIIIAVMAIDFLLRASNQGKYSLLAVLSDAVIKQLKIGNKPVDRAPKRFAAWIGFIFTISILIVIGLKLELTVIILTSILLVFAALESLAGFCAGCYVYSFGLLLVRKKEE